MERGRPNFNIAPLGIGEGMACKALITAWMSMVLSNWVITPI